MEWNLRRYMPSDRELWDEFVRHSRNATFLFERGYMDYHSDRFRDCSWMAFKGGRLMAMLPANIDSDNILHSHQGLTYGGWILPPAHLDGGDLLEIFSCAMEIWRAEGIRELDYKPLPWIYAGQPSEEDIYALFRLGGTVAEVNLSSAINLSCPGAYNKLRKRLLRKASALPTIIGEVADSAEFMQLVEECLRERHDTSPVHTSTEIELLRRRFPENIKLYGLRLADNPETLQAAVMIYDTGRVAHAQYISSTLLGRELNLLTPLFDYLIRDRYSERSYFDFGISNEDHGRYLNEGLLRQKFSYGATGVAYQRWQVKIEEVKIKV
ncbi:MAG: GNAT family N-acetyltransferase [Muribaculaceae bacterium]|nr:GNAT family N-acetyltransferase [Muribaculaceae bacterium]